MRLGVIGTGKISGIYLDNLLTRYQGADIVCIASAHPEHAAKKAAEYGLKASTVDEMLSNPDVEATLILTPVGSHYDLIRRSLLAGKHVYTEKTLTDSLSSAKELLELSRSRGLCLGSAPDTFLGGLFQKARELVDSGILGTVTSFKVCATRDNMWLLPRFTFLLEKGAGVTLDYAVYYMTALVSILGPVASCAALSRNPFQDFTHEGTPLHNPNESELSGVLELASGVTGTFQINADSIGHDIADFAILGTKGILFLDNANMFSGTLTFLPAGKTPDQAETIPITSPLVQNERGLGLSDMIHAIAENRAPRASQELACHVLEVLEGMLTSGKERRFIDILSRPERPAPLTDTEAQSFLK